MIFYKTINILFINQLVKTIHAKKMYQPYQYQSQTQKLSVWRHTS